MPTLRLTLTDYLDAARWRWVLSASRGSFLADHDVRLDPTSREYAGFLDLRAYLDYHQPITPPEAQLADLGAWIGEQVFGGLREALWQHRSLPAVAVQVALPPEAEGAPAACAGARHLARTASETSVPAALLSAGDVSVWCT